MNNNVTNNSVYDNLHLNILENLPHIPDFEHVISNMVRAILLPREYKLKLNLLGEEESFKFKFNSEYNMFVLDVEKNKIDVTELSKQFKKIMKQ